MINNEENKEKQWKNGCKYKSINIHNYDNKKFIIITIRRFVKNGEIENVRLYIFVLLQVLITMCNFALLYIE